MPGPRWSRNFAIGDASDSGASNWIDGPGVADRQHRLADALLLVDLLVRDRHAEDVRVVPDGLVEVGHRDADVVDGFEQT